MKEIGKFIPWRDVNPEKEKIVLVETDRVRPNPYQPRSTFDEEKVQELSQSIKTYGLLQPVIVRPRDNGYELVVGERRLNACRSLGWRTIPAVVKELADNAVATIALIENLQRENLNFIEEARGYNRLIREFNFTQEVLAQRLGKSQSTIANKLRLLKLSTEIQDQILKFSLNERHARALLKITSEAAQRSILDEVVRRGLNVKQTEELVEAHLKKRDPSGDEKKTPKRVVHDLRIFLNTIRQAVGIIQQSGLNPEVTENDGLDYFEVLIRLPKKL